jgi:L-2-hydroxyglutarate oxidase LhgO
LPICFLANCCLLLVATMERIAAVVIGAGVVGLACARQLARCGLETLVLERNDAFGTETSARNSEVIHAGIHYPAGSLKARLCVTGRNQLYRFCEEYGVSHRRCGKLIVATSPNQQPSLATIAEHARASGVTDLQALTGAEAHDLEPQLQCYAALLSPSTGIVDSHGVMLALLGDAERHGAVLVPRSPLLSAKATTGGIMLRVGGVSPTTISADIVVNAAGLSAQQVASTIMGFPAHMIPPTFYAKGNYFSLAAPMPFSRLIYPVPEPGGLGVHLTLDLGGQARFGPDVEWIDEINYQVDPKRARRFYGEIRKYWPGLADNALNPDYAGIRPKTSGRGTPAGDFIIQDGRNHGIHGLINLFGIESPGLTSCLAIAEHVCNRLGLT